MSASMADAAAALTRRWVRVYTTGMARDERMMRRAEIDSDLWEHQRDAATEGAGNLRTAGAVLSRWIRGAPADVLWRFQMEGPKMEFNIPFQKVVGGLLVAMVALLVVAAAISGYDTSREAFPDELTRLAGLNAWENNLNSLFRAATGLGLIGAAAGFYAALQSRSRTLSTFCAFGLVAAGVLTLVASAMQLVFVELADEYVTSSGAHKEQVLVTARGFALAVEATSRFAVLSLFASGGALALFTTRERLVPRKLAVLPALSGLLIASAAIAGASGASGGTWVLFMGAMLCAVLWLLIAGLWMIFEPQASPTSPAEQPAAV